LLRSSVKSPVVALDKISLTVEPGRVCAVIGANGAGKSTLFRILTGLTTPTSGEAYVTGLSTTTESYEVRKRIGFAPAEHNGLLLRHTCIENLVFHGRLQGMSNRLLKRRIREVLELVGLTRARDRLAVALSSGMRARLMLARAVLHRPPVLILDEPTGMVDPIAALEIMGVVQQLVVDEQLGALISSHRLDEVEALNDDVVLLDEGKMVYRGDVPSLRRIWEEPRIEIEFVEQSRADEAARHFESVAGVTVHSTEGATLTLSSAKPLGALLSDANGLWAEANAIRQSKLPMRDLIATVLDKGKPRTTSV
jgi:ABC-2 type transport system ATP-binding protein